MKPLGSQISNDFESSLNEPRQFDGSPRKSEVHVDPCFVLPIFEE